MQPSPSNKCFYSLSLPLTSLYSAMSSLKRLLCNSKWKFKSLRKPNEYMIKERFKNPFILINYAKRTLWWLRSPEHWTVRRFICFFFFNSAKSMNQWTVHTMIIAILDMNATLIRAMWIDLKIPISNDTWKLRSFHCIITHSGC